MRDLTAIERSIDWILVKKKKKKTNISFFFFYTLSMINMVIYECLSVNNCYSNYHVLLEGKTAFNKIDHDIRLIFIRSIFKILL